jgi:hypothetical protein
MRRAGSASPEAIRAERARLRHRLVGQADDVERRHAGRDLHLHVDGTRLDALERHRCDTLDHCRPLTSQGSGGWARRQEQ